MILTPVACPLQIDWGNAEAVGTGRTVTTKLTEAPAQPPTSGVMLYMITALVFVELTGVSEIAPEPLAVTPDNVPITEEVQLNVVPPMEDVGKKLSAVALQISCISEGEVLVTTGAGFTVTTTSKKFPLHPFAVGVIR